MNSFLCFVTVLAVSVQGSNINRGWASTTTLPPTTGWPAPTEPPTTGWPATDPPTTGWPAPPPPPPTGWPAPAPSGWAPPLASSVAINTEGQLVASGSGWAAENHAESAAVLGSSDVPADPLSTVYQEGTIVQVTGNAPEDALAVQQVDVDQVALAHEGVSVYLSGTDSVFDQAGNAVAAGWGAEAAGALTTINISK